MFGAPVRGGGGRRARRPADRPASAHRRRACEVGSRTFALVRRHRSRRLDRGDLGGAIRSPSAMLLFGVTCAVTLCAGHSVGIHRGLIHGAYRAPAWLGYTLVYLGTVVGLGGPMRARAHAQHARLSAESAPVPRLLRSPAKAVARLLLESPLPLRVRCGTSILASIPGSRARSGTAFLRADVDAGSSCRGRCCSWPIGGLAVAASGGPWCA